MFRDKAELRIKSMSKILVFQTWGIGDMIMSTPMLAALRQQLPEAEITLICGSRASADVVQGSALCDRVRILPLGGNSFYHGRMKLLEIIASFYRLRKEHFDMAIVCSRISPYIPLLLKLLSGVRIIAGDGFRSKEWQYTHWCNINRDLHRVESNINILKTLFAESAVSPVCFYVDSDSSNYADKLWKQWRLGNKRVLGIHPGSGPLLGMEKRIPVELCRAVIVNFLEIFPAERVMVFLGPFDMELLRFMSDIDERVVVAQELPLRIIGSLIAKMVVFLAGDTSLGHVASALGVPVVTLAGPTQISTTKPRGDRNVVIKTEEDLACMPCYGTKIQGHCTYQHRCMNSIPYLWVVKAISRFL